MLIYLNHIPGKWQDGNVNPSLLNFINHVLSSLPCTALKSYVMEIVVLLCLDLLYQQQTSLYILKFQFESHEMYTALDCQEGQMATGPTTMFLPQVETTLMDLIPTEDKWVSL